MRTLGCERNEGNLQKACRKCRLLTFSEGISQLSSLTYCGPLLLGEGND